MNLLLLKHDPGAESVSVTGSRAVHIRTVLRAKPGDFLRAGILNGKTGRARIRSIDPDRVVLDSFEFTEDSPAKLPLYLAVALPRPQSFKKVLHFACSAGVEKLVFFQSARVEKSYWNSTVLNPENLEEEIVEGLEQGCSAVPPELSFFRSFREFLHSDFPSDKLRIVAHPVKEEPFSVLPEAAGHVLAVGPEGGFLPSEVEAFEKTGFRKASFGRHILRVEFACAFLAGMLSRRER